MCAAADLAGEVISVASALLTKSGRVILEVLLAGRTDPAGLAEPGPRPAAHKEEPDRHR